MKSWKKISSQVVLNHPRLVAVEDMVQIHTGSIVPYLRFENNSDDCVTVMCVRNDEILLQKEYSYPVDCELYQFPGGKFEVDETPESVAKRELLEESGYATDNVTNLGYYYLNNRRTDAKMFVIECENVYEGESLEGDEEESIKSMWVPFSKLRMMIQDGEITNYSILAALSLYDAKKKKRLN